MTKVASKRPPRKPDARRTTSRRLHASQLHHGCVAIHVEQTTGSRTEHSGYYVTELPACKGGHAFRFERFGAEIEEASEPSHDVFLSTDGFDSCDCIGFQRWHHCRHRDAAKELVRLGKFNAPKPVTAPAPTLADFDGP